MEGRGSWGCLAFHVGIDRCLSGCSSLRDRVVIGPEHLPEVLDLLPLLSFVTYLYVSSEHLGRVMLVEVEVSICVRLLVEDRGEGCSSPPLQLQV